MDELEFFEQERDRYWGIREAADKFLKAHEQDKGTEAYNLILQMRQLATDRTLEMMKEVNRRKITKISHELKDE